MPLILSTLYLILYILFWKKYAPCIIVSLTFVICVANITLFSFKYYLRLHIKIDSNEKLNLSNNQIEIKYINIMMTIKEIKREVQSFECSKDELSDSNSNYDTNKIEENVFLLKNLYSFFFQFIIKSVAK